MADADRTLLFHLGLPKTGSSALQVSFARNHAAFAKQGVDYYQLGEFQVGLAGSITSGNGSILSRAVHPEGHPIRPKDAERHVQDFLDAAKASAQPRGLISSELFAFADDARMRELLDAVRALGYAPRAIFLVRRQDQWLASSYMQQVKRHQCTQLPADNIRAAYRKIGFLKYDDYAQRTEALFGEGAVSCLVYEDARADALGLFGAFLRAMRLDPAGFDVSSKDVNTSLSPASLLMMLALNRYEPRMRFSDIVVENDIRAGGMRAGVRHDLLGDAFSREIEDYFRDQNAALARRYFGRERLFAPFEPTGQEQGFAPRDISNEEIVNFLGGVIVKLDARLASQGARLTTLERDVARLLGKP